MQISKCTSNWTPYILHKHFKLDTFLSLAPLRFSTSKVKFKGVNKPYERLSRVNVQNVHRLFTIISATSRADKIYIKLLAFLISVFLHFRLFEKFFWETYFLIMFWFYFKVYKLVKNRFYSKFWQKIGFWSRFYLLDSNRGRRAKYVYI